MEDNTKPLFRPFSWLYNRNPSKEETLISDTRDIAFGLTAILQLLEIDGLRAENEDQPILSPLIQADLLRLAIVNARLLGELAEKEICQMNQGLR